MCSLGWFICRMESCLKLGILFGILTTLAVGAVVKYGSEDKTYQAATEICKKIGPEHHLPNDETDGAALAEYMRENNMKSTWISIQRQSLKEWTWRNGAVATGLRSAESGACGGAISTNLTIHAISCGAKEPRGVVCQHQGIMKCPDTVGQASCFTLEETTFTLTCDVGDLLPARETCRKQGARLAVLDTEDKLTAFGGKNLTGAPCRYYWVGLLKEQWVHSGQKPRRVTKDQWFPGEPSARLNCSTADLHTDGIRWKATRCSDTRGVICQKSNEKGPVSFAAGPVDKPDPGKDGEKGTPFYQTIGFQVALAVGAIAVIVVVIAGFMVRRRRAATQKRNLNVVEDTLPLMNVGATKANIAFLAPPCVTEKLPFKKIKVIQNNMLAAGALETDCKWSKLIIEFLSKQLTNTIMNIQNATGKIIKNVAIEHVVVPGEVIGEPVLEKALDYFLESDVSVVYLPIQVMQPVDDYVDFEEKLHRLMAKCVVITTATVPSPFYDMARLAQSSIAVGSGSIHTDTDPGTACGGLLDFVLQPEDLMLDNTIENEEEYDSNQLAGAGAMAAAAAILLGANFVDGIALDSLKSSHVMRRVLIDLCTSPNEHHVTDGFGHLRLKEIPADPDKIRKLTEDHLSQSVNMDERSCLIRENSRRYSESTARGIMKSGTTANFVKVQELLKGKAKMIKLVMLGTDEKMQFYARLFGIPIEGSRIVAGATWSQWLVPFWADVLGVSLRDTPKHYLKYIQDSRTTYEWDDYDRDHDEYREAIEQVANRNQDIVIQTENMAQPLATSRVHEILNKIKKNSVVLTSAFYDPDNPGHTFPSSDVIGVGVVSPDLDEAPYMAAGGRLDFVAPIEVPKKRDNDEEDQSIEDYGPWYAAVITAFVLMTAKAHGIDDAVYRQLKTTSVMRRVLIDMCSHPWEYLPGEGYGVLDPWHILVDWQKLKSIIDKYTDDATDRSYWAGKEI